MVKMPRKCQRNDREVPEKCQGKCQRNAREKPGKNQGNFHGNAREMPGKLPEKCQELSCDSFLIAVKVFGRSNYEIMSQ